MAFYSHFSDCSCTSNLKALSVVFTLFCLEIIFSRMNGKIQPLPQAGFQFHCQFEHSTAPSGVHAFASCLGRCCAEKLGIWNKTVVDGSLQGHAIDRTFPFCPFPNTGFYQQKLLFFPPLYFPRAEDFISAAKTAGDGSIVIVGWFWRALLQFSFSPCLGKIWVKFQ